LEWIATAYLSNWGEGDGYFPMPVTNNGMTKVVGKDHVFKPHPKCLEYLDDIVKTCQEKNIEIILCVSPSLSYSMHGLNDLMKEYGDKKRVQTFDFTGDTTYVDHPNLFFDATHLNDKGARIFTKDFITALQ
jgi:2-hydroxy-3-keto-5-methylthiopentenyl-1-phosphate phosphatase